MKHKATKRHTVADGNGIPLALTLSAANVHDTRKALPTVDRIRVGAKRRPTGLAADKGYDSMALRRQFRARGIRASIPERQFTHRRKLGRPPLNDPALSGNRWVIERTNAWFDNFRKLSRRMERSLSSYHAISIVGAIMICLGSITK